MIRRSFLGRLLATVSLGIFPKENRPVSADNPVRGVVDKMVPLSLPYGFCKSVLSPVFSSNGRKHIGYELIVRCTDDAANGRPWAWEVGEWRGEAVACLRGLMRADFPGESFCTTDTMKQQERDKNPYFDRDPNWRPTHVHLTTTIIE